MCSSDLNRPDVLDPALLRPGRFDRQVVIPLPNQAERLAILAVHCRAKQLDDDVELAKIARSTPGFSGADLANLANEAAIVAVRDDRWILTAADFEAARDRIILGRREKGTVLLSDERRLVAAHEAGHALVAALSPRADPVEKVSILPAGQALGVTHQLPVDERHLYTKSWFDDFLAVRLAGRAAEEDLRPFGGETRSHHGEHRAIGGVDSEPPLCGRLIEQFTMIPNQPEGCAANRRQIRQ